MVLMQSCIEMNYSKLNIIQLNYLMKRTKLAFQGAIKRFDGAVISEGVQLLVIIVGAYVELRW